MRRTRVIEILRNRIQLLPIVNIQPNRYLHGVGWVRRTNFVRGSDEWRRIVLDQLTGGSNRSCEQFRGLN